MPEDPERVIREVTFAVEGDGRTIEARIVPYNTPTKVVDHPRNGGSGVPYLERWIPGAFEKQVNAAHRVWLNVEHEPGFRAVVGHGTALREEPDALYGTFRVEPGSDGDKALHMVNEGVLTGLSIEAIPKQTRNTVEGVVERVKATLDKVSLVREGLAAYKEAAVLAVRENPDEPEPDEPAPEPEPDSPSEAELALERVGFERLTVKSVVRKPWHPGAARFEDEEYERSCLIDRGGDLPVKERCSLPVLEPNGDVNANALGAAAAMLSGARAGLKNVNSGAKSKAARKLLRYYAQADMEAPPALRQVAQR